GFAVYRLPRSVGRAPARASCCPVRGLPREPGVAGASRRFVAMYRDGRGTAQEVVAGGSIGREVAIRASAGPEQPRSAPILAASGFRLTRTARMWPIVPARATLRGGGRA